MSDIQRYDIDQIDFDSFDMTEEEYGKYVKYEDHAAIVTQLETELAEARKDQALTFEDAIKIAKGCTDYGGGYRSNPYELEVYHHGMGTVVNCLEAALKNGLKDTQVAVVYSIGSAAIKEQQ